MTTSSITFLMFIPLGLMVDMALKQLHTANRQGEIEAVRTCLNELRSAIAAQNVTPPDDVKREIRKAEHILEINTIRQSE